MVYCRDCLALVWGLFAQETPCRGLGTGHPSLGWGALTPSGGRAACSLPRRGGEVLRPGGCGRQEVQRRGRWAPSLLRGCAWVDGRGLPRVAVPGWPQPGRTSSSTGPKKSRAKQNPEAPFTPPDLPTTRSRPRRSPGPGVDGPSWWLTLLRDPVLETVVPLWADLSALKLPFTKHAAARGKDITPFSSFAGGKKKSLQEKNLPP